MADHIHLVFQTGLVLFRAIGVAVGKAVRTEFVEPAVRIVALRILELRQVVGAKLKIHPALLHHFDGVFDGLRVLRKQGAHFVLALDIELLRLKLHAPGIV